MYTELTDIKAKPEVYVGKFIDLSQVHCDDSLVLPIIEISDGVILSREDMIYAFIEKEVRLVCREKGIMVIVVSKNHLMQENAFFDAICDDARYLVLLK